jgi:hypothetical protein
MEIPVWSARKQHICQMEFAKIVNLDATPAQAPSVKFALQIIHKMVRQVNVLLANHNRVVPYVLKIVKPALRMAVASPAINIITSIIIFAFLAKLYARPASIRLFARVAKRAIFSTSINVSTVPPNRQLLQSTLKTVVAQATVRVALTL